MIEDNHTIYHKVLLLFISALIFGTKELMAQNLSLSDKGDFKPMLLKVEASTDQLEPDETLWLTCWWQPGAIWKTNVKCSPAV